MGLTRPVQGAREASRPRRIRIAVRSRSRFTRFVLVAASLVSFALMDRPPGTPARAIGWWWSRAAEAAAVSGDAMPAFVRFGWCSPPGPFTTPERMREYRDAGMNAVLPE